MASCRPRKNKSGEIISYEIRVSRGYDPVTKKAIKPYTTTFTPPEGWSDNKIKRELNRTAGEFEAACKRGEVLTKEQQIEAAKVEQGKMTFKKYVKIFMLEKATSLTPNTIVSYKNAFERAATTFDDVKMAEINKSDLRQYINNLQINGKNQKNGKPLAYQSILKHYRALHVLFAVAAENDIIPFNPMQAVKIPKARKEEIIKQAVVYNEKEARYILECLNKEPLKWRAIITLMLESGCRRGEIIGLKWSDFDMDTHRVNICRNALMTSGKGVYLHSPKNGKSRIIMLSEEVLTVLKEWQSEQTAIFTALRIENEGFCFNQSDGKMMNPQQVTDYLQRFGKKYGLPGIHPHALRHTMITISIAQGIDVVTVSKKAGHSTPSVTLNVYSHANESAQVRATETLSKAIYKNNKQVEENEHE